MNIARNLQTAALHFPDRPAVIEEGREISFLEFSQESNRVATALIGLGIRSGDRVALCAPSSYRWLAFYFGALAAGAAAVTLSNVLTGAELTQIVDDARPKILFTEDERLNDLGDRGHRPYLETIISHEGDISYERLLEKGTASFRVIERDRSDTAAVLYTGGTTGIPKGVMLTHENLMISAHNISYHERSVHTDCALCFLPLNHVFAQVHIMNATIYSGGRVVLQSSFDLEKVIDTIRRNRVTKFYAVPTIYIRLLSVDNLKEELASVRYCFSAAASMASELVREWKERMDLNIHESYGMTESAAMVTYNHYYRHVIGSVGTPVSTIEVQIRDLDGNVLGTGDEGEICICGPNIMKGYLNKPEETRVAFWDRWFRSGDIGLMDEKRYLFIVDRLKDMIITGGENVYPREIEEVLYTRPEVGECAVVGLPDKEYGERVTAFIIPKKDREIDPADLKSYLKTRLSPFKVPKQFLSISELPKSAAGKILKRALRKKVLEELKK